MNNKRELWPDKVKFIAVVMVILSHLPYNIPFVNGLYAPVFIPLFFYVSGYFYKKSLDSLLKRTRALLVPFLLIGTLLAYLYSSSALNVYPESNFKDNFINLILNISGNHDIFWFLPCMILTNLIVFSLILGASDNLVLLSSMSIIIAIVGSLIDIHIPWHIEIAMVAQVFMIFGYIIRKKDILKKLFNSHRIGLVFPIIYTMLVILDRIVFGKKYDLHMAEYGSAIVIYILLGCIGSISITYIAQFIPDNVTIMRVGQNSLLFYAFQYSFITIFNIIFNKLGIDEILKLNIVTRSLGTVLYLCLCMVGCYILALIINKYIPELIGKKRCKN